MKVKYLNLDGAQATAFIDERDTKLPLIPGVDMHTDMAVQLYEDTPGYIQA